MSVLELKNELLQLVADSNDSEQLNKVVQYFKQLSQSSKRQEAIAAQEDRMIELAEKQIANGEILSNEEALSKIDAHLNAKKQ